MVLVNIGCWEGGPPKSSVRRTLDRAYDAASEWNVYYRINNKRGCQAEGCPRVSFLRLEWLFSYNWQWWKEDGLDKVDFGLSIR